MTTASRPDARLLADEHGLRYVDLTPESLAPGAGSLLPEAVAREFHVVPIGRRLGTPVVAVSDPRDESAKEAIQSNLGRDFVMVVAEHDQISEALVDLYPQGVDPSPNGSSELDPRTAAMVGDGHPNGSSVGTNGSTPEPGSGGVTVDDLIKPEAAAGSLEESLRDVLSPPTDSGILLHGAGAGEGGEQLQATIDNVLSPLNEGGPTVLTPEGVPSPPSGFSPMVDSAANLPSDLPPLPDGYGIIEGEGGSSNIAYGPPLARVLVESGRVTAEEMAQALQAHQETGESLARYLYNNKLAKEDDLVWAMAQEVGLEFVDLSTIPIDRSVTALIPEATARHHMVLPFRIENGVPVVAMANPTDVFAMDDLRTIMGRNFTPVVATRSQIAASLRYAHDGDLDVTEVAGDAEAGAAGSSGFELETLQSVVEDAPIVRYVNLLILQALNERASDIHIEPTPKRLRIRFRIDGVMHDATSASSSIANAVVSRLKVLGEMDITEHRIPQEGRVSLSVSDRQIDLRLASLPSIYGETVVMRLLDKSASIRTLPDLGFFPEMLGRYSSAYSRPYGVILVTGPTGAGKTTTLYATLNEVLTPEKAVVTVEDPVEYQIDGITQVQINLKAGLRFATVLKSILRADPDIILIGEIRDADTAKVAMEAALSGHLVLSTLHTNSAAGTPLRLTEMGIEPFLVTSAVSTVLTQRLARVLCNACKEPYDATEAEFIAAGYKEPDLVDVDTSKLYRATGCRTCSHTGFLGRMVMAEVMNMSEEIDRLIIEKATTVEIERIACQQGMRTLRQDGLLKAVAGLTTLEEVLRVVV